MTRNEYQLTFIVGTFIFWGMVLLTYLVYISAKHELINIDTYLFFNNLVILGVIMGGLIIITNEFGSSINRVRER